MVSIKTHNLLVTYGYKQIAEGYDSVIYADKKEDNIIKILSYGEEDEIFDEVALSEYFRKNFNQLKYSDLIPQYKAIGVINETPIIIRENIRDILFNEEENELFASIFLDILEKRIVDENDLYSKWEKSEISETIITKTEVLKLAQSLIDFINDGIIPHDIHLHNLGRDGHDNLKIRDFSRFVITLENKELYKIYKNQDYYENDLHNNLIKSAPKTNQTMKCNLSE